MSLCIYVAFCPITAFCTFKDSFKIMSSYFYQQYEIVGYHFLLTTKQWKMLDERCRCKYLFFGGSYFAPGSQITSTSSS
ncbi:hypothetical protein Y032_0307g2019 [Ancylostoma ceylanicum]|uniref:Uncharacterized protein n=1 Tax=Ancylostoma ceylanicum TaxID=53326 RepID=A0A016S3U0_9BILA|nr:hypothetical protein Y032_0307g2019 [Ancylostoma ceylanicum]